MGECEVCKDYLEEARTATKRHINAQSRLRTAAIRFEHEALPGLQSVVDQAARAREEAVGKLRLHLASHG